MDPYTITPLGARPGVARRRSRRGRCSTPGKATEREMAEVVAAQPPRRDRQPERAGQRATSTSTSCSTSRTSRRRCARTTCRRSPTAPRAVIIATRRQGARAHRATRCGSAASTTASSRTSPGLRDLTTSPSTQLARRRCRRRRRPDRRRRAARSTYSHEEIDPRARRSAWATTRRQPVGRTARRPTR